MHREAGSGFGLDERLVVALVVSMGDVSHASTDVTPHSSHTANPLDRGWASNEQ